MKPTGLRAESFGAYPTRGRELATQYLPMFQRMPLILVALIFRQLIQHDWSFPAERRRLEAQLEFLSKLSKGALDGLLAEFQTIPLTGALENSDWVGQPQVFSEQLTAYLWSQHLIDSYHQAARNYGVALDKNLPSTTPATARWTIVVIGKGSPPSKEVLFGKLLPHGTLFTQLDPAGALESLMACVKDRARQQPEGFGHWYIDGGELHPGALDPTITSMSYNSIVPAARHEFELLKQFTTKTQAGNAVGAEAVGSYISSLTPEDLSLRGEDSAAVLRHFEVNLITQGAGCQIFSTTFVQWAARECLHRAQPLTLLARFGTRQYNAPMEHLLARDPLQQPQDAEGSLIDADMGAYYTWINQSRLPGAQQARFLAWFEDQRLACAIAPTLPEGTTSSQPITMPRLLDQLT
jgi:hypothetical protein